MQSFFEFSKKIPFDVNVFENMKKSAFQLLHNSKKSKYTQIIVLFSATNKEYVAIIKNALSKEKNEELSLIERLKKAEDTEVRYVLCIWQDGCIDIPSYGFRKMLYDLNSNNSKSLLFVMRRNGISVMELSKSINK